MPSRPQSEQSKLYSAKLVSSQRITPESSPEDVRHLIFKMIRGSFKCKVGTSIRVMVPLQSGSQYHARFYSIADPIQTRGDSTEFSLCVRRCYYIDDFDGGEYKGVASNYLCDLQPGDFIEFEGPFGLAFPVPEDKSANILMIGMGTGIAPFRAYIRHIYENVGEWEGKIRLFYGARTGLEMLYMNKENNDLANYYDEKTFKAFQAISPRSYVETPIALDRALEQNAAEVLATLQSPNTYIFFAGLKPMLTRVEKALAGIAGSEDEWNRQKSDVVSKGRWTEILY